MMNTMIEKPRHFSTGLGITVLLVLSACATERPSVVEKLDERTAVTITHNRTPIVMSTDTPFNPRGLRDYVEVGAIEVNRTGTLRHFLWLGISVANDTDIANGRPEGFESIDLIAGDEQFQLDVLGWTHEAIGTSERVYKKLYSSSIDAYYEITLDQIQLLAEADGMKVRTKASVPKEFVLWYKPTTAKVDLTEFLKTVLQ